MKSLLRIILLTVLPVTFSMIGAAALHQSFAKKDAKDKAFRQLSASAHLAGTLLETRVDRLGLVLHNALEHESLSQLFEFDSSDSSEQVEAARRDLEGELIHILEADLDIATIEILDEVGKRIVAVGKTIPPIDEFAKSTIWYQTSRTRGHDARLIDGQLIRVSRSMLSGRIPGAVATMTYELPNVARSACSLATRHLEQCEVRVLDGAGKTLFVDRELPKSVRTLDAFSPTAELNCAVSISQADESALYSFYQARRALFSALSLVLFLAIIMTWVGGRFINGKIKDAEEAKRTLVDALEKSKLELKQATDRLAIHEEELAASKKRAELANRSKAAFIANVSQEIRTPLTSIIGYAEVLLKDASLSNTSAANIGPLATIHQHGKYVIRIIDDVLDLSRIESRKIKIESSNFSLSKLFADLEKKMQPRAEKKGLAWNVKIDPSLPKTISTDAKRLYKIIINLLGNAFRFTQAGSVTLSAKLAQHTDELLTLEISVIDTGIGIEPSQLEKIFQPFVKLDVSLAKEFNGIGLGLPISSHFANLLGGKISVQSKPGTGSKFTLRLGVPNSNPTELHPQNTVEEPKTSVEYADSPLVNARVLVVDDNLINQNLISLVLSRAGAEVEVADNGLSGLDLALDAYGQGKPYDVILMDMQMPVMDGATAVKELREGGYHNPIVALTAHTMTHDQEKCMDAGCDAYAIKPIDHGKLIDLVASFVLADKAISSA